MFTKMAAELVESGVDILVGAGTAAYYLKRATATIPIVFMYIPDPVGSGLVETIRRPGGNATGLSNFAVLLSAKRLQYLKAMVPSITRVALLVNPTVKITDLYIRDSAEAGAKLGITTHAFPVRSLNDLQAAFDAMVAARMEGVIVNAESLMFQGKHVIAKLALGRKLPHGLPQRARCQRHRREFT